MDNSTDQQIKSIISLPADFISLIIISRDRKIQILADIFFIDAKSCIAICFLETYILLRSKFHYLPESFIIIFTGAAVGGSFAITYGHLPGDFEVKLPFIAYFLTCGIFK
ncbi:hypothetical protein AVEN_12099-1, partial [Araneus ventricosus]